MVLNSLKLKEHGALLESIFNFYTYKKVAAAAYKVAVGVIYVTQSLADKGSTIPFHISRKGSNRCICPIAVKLTKPRRW